MRANTRFVAAAIPRMVEAASGPPGPRTPARMNGASTARRHAIRPGIPGSPRIASRSIRKYDRRAALPSFCQDLAGGRSTMVMRWSDLPRISVGTSSKKAVRASNSAAGRGIAALDRLGDRPTEIRPDESLEIGSLEGRAGRLVGDLLIDLGRHLAEDPASDVGHLDRAHRRRPRDRRDRLDGLFRTGTRPFEDRLSDHLDVSVRSQQSSDRPGLVAEDAPLEPQIAEQGAMEDLAGRGRVVQEARDASRSTCDLAGGCRGCRRAATTTSARRPSRCAGR